MNAEVTRRIEELKNEVPKAIDKCHKEPNLPACVNDIDVMLNFAIEELGVKPENVILLVTEDLFK